MIKRWKLGILMMLMVLVGACAGTTRAYRTTTSLEDTAKIVSEHYYALVREANTLAADGSLVGGQLAAVQSVVRTTVPLVTRLGAAAQAWGAVKSAMTEAELQAALDAAMPAVSSLIDALRNRDPSGRLDRRLNEHEFALLLAGVTS